MDFAWADPDHSRTAVEVVLKEPLPEAFLAAGRPEVAFHIRTT